MRSLVALSLLLFCPIMACAQAYTAVSYNIRYANSHDRKNAWEFRKEAVRNTLLDLQPTVFGLQEVLRDQLAYLHEHLPTYAHFGVGRDDGIASGEFAPVFYDPSVFDLLNGRTIWLSPTPDVPSKGWDATCNRIVTLVILRDRSTGDSLWVANTHWDAVGSGSREQSARIVSELLAGPIARGRRTLFMGDLNSKATEAPVDHLRTLMADACPKERRGRGTFNAFHRLRLFSKRIDFVWLSPQRWDVVRYSVPRPKVNCRQVSDHFPVVVDLRAR